MNIYIIAIEFMQGGKLEIPCPTQYARKLLLEKLQKGINEGKKIEAVYNKDNELSFIVRLDNINFIYCYEAYRPKINGDKE